MAKSEETNFSIKSKDNQNNIFSLLLPYYTTDKWINKLKQRVKFLSDRYNKYYQNLEEENNPFYRTQYNKKI